jgi:hypothetical protein
VALSSNLNGIESRLPAPFDKARAQAVGVSAELAITPEGIREFQVNGHNLEVRGQVGNGVTSARFDVHGLEGEFRRSAKAVQGAELHVERLALERAPEVLAVATALMPVDGDIRIDVRDSRYAERSLGPLHASVAREQGNISFGFDSPAVAMHQLSGRGRCGAEGRCRADFSADTTQLATLLRDVSLPAEWPAARLHANGTLDWPMDASRDVVRQLAGRFDLRTESADGEHQLLARATLADGEVVLSDVQGTGPEPDQVFRGQGRVGLVARDYDLTVDYERVALAATGVPSPARARLARAWNAMRGTAARRGWTDPPEARRVQWHGTWD